MSLLYTLSMKEGMYFVYSERKLCYYMALTTNSNVFLRTCISGESSLSVLQVKLESLSVNAVTETLGALRKFVYTFKQENTQILQKR